jgi:phosphoribosyl 1,2-cyclic phosphate phosphodiesterase
MLRYTFLGTGTSQGVPLIGCQCKVCTSADTRDQRLRTSLHIQSDTTSIVVDAGPDFRQQMLRHKIYQLDAVLLTHSHKDHIAGLDDVRAYNFMQKKSMPVYGNAFTLQELRREFPYIFDGNNYPGIPKIDVFELQGFDNFTIGDIDITVIPVMHLMLPVWCYLFNKEFAYITDANFLSEETKAIIKDVDVLVLNALRQESHVSHFSLEEAIAVSDEVGAKQTYFVHASHQLGTYEDVSGILPHNKLLAYDGLVVNL